MWSYILKRILLMIPTLLGVLTLTFAVIQFVPGQASAVTEALFPRTGAQGAAPNSTSLVATVPAVRPGAVW